MPMNSKKIFPNIAKNDITNDDVKKITMDNFITLSIDIEDDSAAKIGIKATGSIAIKVFKMFWKKIS